MHHRRWYEFPWSWYSELFLCTASSNPFITTKQLNNGYNVMEFSICYWSLSCTLFCLRLCAKIPLKSGLRNDYFFICRQCGRRKSFAFDACINNFCVTAAVNRESDRCLLSYLNINPDLWWSKKISFSVSDNKKKHFRKSNDFYSMASF